MDSNLAPLLELVMAQQVKENWKEIVDAKIPDNKIKIKPGKFKAKYIEGSTAIDILNRAFDGRWTFVPLEERIEKVLFNGKESGSYALVKGALIVPGLGMKIQYGTQAIVGGVDQQQSAYKGAGTDCLKKCASLFGVGAELYESEESHATNNYNNNYQATKYAKPEGWKNNANNSKAFVNEFAQPQQPVAPAWNPADTDKLKQLKASMQLNDNNQLDPFVKEFVSDLNASWSSITPTNIKAFNDFLEKKIIES